MTAIDYLFNELWEVPKDKLTWHSILSKAKEIESSQASKDAENTSLDNSPKVQNKDSFGEISDDEIFKQSVLAMEERYGSGCDEEIDAHFRGAVWHREQLKLRQ